jgi:hypothetical protein
MKPRHAFALIVLLLEAPILAPVVVGWVISGLIYATVLTSQRVPARLGCLAERFARHRRRRVRVTGRTSASRAR